MERGQQDQIIITVDSDNHYIYFSVKEGHSGTIIDLVKRYVNDNLGHVRKTLRQWRGGTALAPAPAAWPRLEKTTKDLNRVAQEWRKPIRLA